MPSNLLVLALLAGFLFVHRCYQFKFRAQMLDGYRLLLHCSFAGAAILVGSRALICFAKLFPLFWPFRPFWTRAADLPYVGTFLFCVPLSFLAAAVWNLFLDPERCRQTAVVDHGDSLMNLMQAAVSDSQMISVTFESRKWYVGYLPEAPDLKPSEKYFKLHPVLSGYRDKDTLVARRTLSYFNLDAAFDFVIVLPLQQVRTANLFDPVVYEDHFSDSEDAV